MIAQAQRRARSEGVATAAASSCRTCRSSMPATHSIWCSASRCCSTFSIRQALRAAVQRMADISRPAAAWCCSKRRRRGSRNIATPRCFAPASAASIWSCSPSAACEVRAITGVDPAPFKTWLLPHLPRLPRALSRRGAGIGDGAVRADRCAVRPARRQPLVARGVCSGTCRRGINMRISRRSITRHRRVRAARRAGGAGLWYRNAAASAPGQAADERHGERHQRRRSRPRHAARSAVHRRRGGWQGHHLDQGAEDRARHGAAAARQRAWHQHRRAEQADAEIDAQRAGKAARCSMSPARTRPSRACVIRNCPAAGILLRAARFRLQASDDRGLRRRRRSRGERERRADRAQPLRRTIASACASPPPAATRWW